MTAKIEVFQVVDRPLASVFHFCATEHVRNHPRWDADIELEQISDGPIGVGTLIRRRNSRSGTPVEGTMEVTGFELNRSMSMEIHDGPAVMFGRLLFEAVNDKQTKITTLIELPGMDEDADMSFLLKALERRDQTMKRLIETEINE